MREKVHRNLFWVNEVKKLFTLKKHLQYIYYTTYPTTRTKNQSENQSSILESPVTFRSQRVNC